MQTSGTKVHILTHGLNIIAPTPSRDWDNIRDIFMAMSMSAVIIIAVDTLSNTAESEKTNKLIDDPDRDVMFKRIFFFRKCY